MFSKKDAKMSPIAKNPITIAIITTNILMPVLKVFKGWHNSNKNNRTHIGATKEVIIIKTPPI